MPTEPAEPGPWAVRFAVRGDLRFCSHHDMLRAVERLTARAGLPVRYSQGYNPRPRMSLLPPRPVGVAAEDDLLVLHLTRAASPADLLSRLNAEAPSGLRFASAAPASQPAARRVARVCYALRLEAAEATRAAAALDGLRGQDAWFIERLTRPRGGRGWTPRRIDLRPLVEQVDLAGNTLRMTLVAGGDLWARPGEVLRLLGLEAEAHRVVRTAVETHT
jgi:radical SAM-linked protein